jgi:hypothetical protein
MKKALTFILCCIYYLNINAQIPFADLLLGMQFGGDFSDVSATQAILTENTASLTSDRNGIDNNAALFEGNKTINFDFSANGSLLAGAENGQITLTCRIQLNDDWLSNLALNTEFNLLNNGKSYLRMVKGELGNVLILKGGVFNNNTLQGTNGLLQTSLTLRNTVIGNLPDWNPGPTDWNTFTLTYDANFGEPVIGLFVNGILKASNNVNYNATNLTYDIMNEKFEIGSSDFLPQGFSGKIDDIYLYNRSLTLGEITTLDTVNIFTGIKNVTELSGIKLYPNPTENALHIISNKELGDIELYDLLGNLLFKEDVKDFQYQLDLTTYSTGIYNVKVGNAFFKAIKR